MSTRGTARGPHKRPLTLTTATGTYTIRRSWRPNDLTVQHNDIDPVVVSDDNVARIVGMTEGEFKSTVIIGQFATTFFDLPPSAKMAVLTDALNLDRWLTYSTRAKDRGAHVDREYHNKERDLTRCLGNIEALEEQINNAAIAAEQYEDDREARLSKARGRALVSEAAALAAAIDAGHIDSSRATYTTDYDNARAAVAATVAGVDAANNALGAVKTEKSIAEHDLVSATRRKQELEDRFSLPTCELCGQPIDSDHASTQIKSADGAVDACKARLEEVSLKYAAAAREQRRTQELYDGAEAYAAARRSAADNITHEYDMAMSAVRAARADLDTRKQNVATLEQADNPHVDGLERAITALEKIEGTRAALNQQIDKLSQQRERCDFWTRGFKDIRLEVVREALAAFEIAVNNNLQALGLDGWVITFDVERLRKTGGVSKGFTVLVRGPANTDDVPWEAWSGGEGQRLRLAGALGLSDLIQGYSGTRCNLLALDEPTQHLSQQGVVDLVALLHDKARADDKQIWLIDHNTVDSGLFTDTLTIIKDANGSTITPKVVGSTRRRLL